MIKEFLDKYYWGVRTCKICKSKASFQYASYRWKKWTDRGLFNTTKEYWYCNGHDVLEIRKSWVDAA